MRKKEEEETNWLWSALGVIIVNCLVYSCVNSCGNEGTDDAIKKDVKIVQQYDCPKIFSDGDTRHQLCGVVENNTSKEVLGTVKVYYYDADGTKIGDYSGYIAVEPHSKAKFETMFYQKDEPFDHYKVKLKVY